jgi:hypothetical protein
MEIGRKGNKDRNHGQNATCNMPTGDKPLRPVNRHTTDLLTLTHSPQLHSHLTSLNPIVEQSFGRQCQTAMTFCMSGLKVSVADIRLSLLNAIEGAAQHTEGA